MSLHVRTWPYGTIIIGTVFMTQTSPPIIAVKGDDGEGYILLGGNHQYRPADGERVVMQFTAGGPTGGYWKILRKETP